MLMDIKFKFQSLSSQTLLSEDWRILQRYIFYISYFIYNLYYLLTLLIIAICKNEAHALGIGFALKSNVTDHSSTLSHKKS